MSFQKKSIFLLLVLLVIICFCGVTMGGGIMYKVGDTAGWTKDGVDYKAWSASKTFHVGDSILFEYAYGTQPQNVLEVTHKAFRSCNDSHPYGIYKFDMIPAEVFPFSHPGHYYYICNLTGHCQSGQKVHIHVVRPTTTTTITPSPSSSFSPAPFTTESPVSAPTPLNMHLSPDVESRASFHPKHHVTTRTPARAHTSSHHDHHITISSSHALAPAPAPANSHDGSISPSSSRPRVINGLGNRNGVVSLSATGLVMVLVVTAVHFSGFAY